MVKGWYRESRRHSLASRGIKTAQKVPKIPKTIEKASFKKDVRTIKKVRDYLIKTMPKAQKTPSIGARYLGQTNWLRTVGVLPTADQFRKFSSEYVPGQVTNRVYHRLKASEFQVTSLYLELVDDDVKNPRIAKALRKMDIGIMKYLSKEGKPDSLDFTYKFIKDNEDKEQLIMYGKEFPHEEPELFNLLIDKVKRG